MIFKVIYSASAFSLRHSNNWSLNFQPEKKKSAGTPNTVEIKDKLRIQFLPLNYISGGIYLLNVNNKITSSKFKYVHSNNKDTRIF